MADLALPVLFTLFAWWFSTGVILYLDGLPPRTFPFTLQAATVVLGAALYALVHTRNDTSVAGAYCAFSCALLVWAWQEIAFLLGVVTGPRRSACPPGATGWRRTGYAIQAVLYHELALIVLAIAVAACVGPGENRVGLWTFLALWGMRQSAKLNIFLGVRNIGEHFLPLHLRYMASYFRRAPMNPLFPVSVTLATGAAVLVWWRLLDGPTNLATSAFDTAGLALVGSMLALGALEHWLLVLPLPTDALWRWGMKSHTKTTAVAAPAPLPSEAG
ncbi:MAG: putative photosynthetic complex assembly protein PuhE [Pseudomonadota bacterium]